MMTVEGLSVLSAHVALAKASYMVKPDGRHQEKF